MNHFECHRHFPLGVLHAVLAFSFASLGFGQNAMPPLTDHHFCEWWHARLAPPDDLHLSPHHGSKKPDSSDNPHPQMVSDDLGTAAPVDPDTVTESNEPAILEAIGCLLQLEGDTHPANVMGVTGAGVSEVFDWAPTNLAALYYASCLFTGSCNHGNPIALRGPGAEVPEPKGKSHTSRWAIYKAYGSYRRWYDQVKTMGLTRARAERLDPLEGTALYWY